MLGKIHVPVDNLGPDTITYILTDKGQYKVDERIKKALGFQRSCMGWHFTTGQDGRRVICYGNGSKVWV